MEQNAEVLGTFLKYVRLFLTQSHLKNSIYARYDASPEMSISMCIAIRCSALNSIHFDNAPSLRVYYWLLSTSCLLDDYNFFMVDNAT